LRNKPLTALALSTMMWLGNSTAAAQVPTGDSVIGGASLATTPPDFPVFELSFSFHAQSGPSGEQPSGTATWQLSSRFGTAGGGGNVTCLAVSESAAIIGTFNGSTATFFAVGGGSVGFGAVTTATAPTVCPPGLSGPYSQFFPPTAMQSFHVTIVDAPPLPTTLDQCKKGGWKTYGVFKNQGDCISFVATKGKNPPASP
jgi:hypothetical protein